MADNQQPATKQDLADLRTETKQDLAALKQDLADLKQDLTDFKVETKQNFESSKNEVLEAVRDMQTEILRGLERFARGNFTRLHRLENSDNDLNERINSLEERVLTLETHRPIL